MGSGVTKTERKRVEAFLRDLARVCVAHGVTMIDDACIQLGEYGSDNSHIISVAYEPPFYGGKIEAREWASGADPFASVEVDASPPPF